MSSEPITTCPDENELLDFVGGGAPSGALETHLAGCERCRSTVAQLVTSDVSLRSVELPAGASVGRYTIVRLVGAGAMGRVFLAFDPLLDRSIALKMLHPLGESEAAREDLLSEAKSLARVSHPNLVTAHDAGLVDGSVFIAMELVTGQTLRAWSSSPRSEKAVVDAYLQAARGLAAMHDAGLIHRDFKPDNVLIGQDGRVRISDFGLAHQRIEDDASSDAPFDTSSDAHTQPGTGGTPAYMAPEQLEDGLFDERTDQFAFCCALTEALTGSRPFRPNSRAEVRKGLSLPRVSRRVSRVLRRGLHVDPSQRFPSMHALISALEPSRWTSSFAIATASLSLLALSFAAFSFHQRSLLCSSGEQRFASVFSPARSASLSSHFSSLGPPGLASLPPLLSSLHSLSQDWVSAFKDNCEATRLRGEQPDSVFVARSRCLDRRLVELDEALSVLLLTPQDRAASAIDTLSAVSPPSVCTQAQAAREQTTDPNTPQVSSMERALVSADAALLAGRTEEGIARAQELQRQAQAVNATVFEGRAAWIEARARAAEPITKVEPILIRAWSHALEAGDDVLAIRTAVALSDRLERERDRQDEASDWLWSAQSFMVRITDQTELTEQVGARACRLALRGSDGARSERECRLAAEFAERTHGPAHLHTARSLAAWGDWLAAHGRADEALQARRRVVAIASERLGPGHPETGEAQLELGMLLLSSHQPTEALAVTESALLGQRVQLPTSEGTVARLLLLQAQLLERLGRTAEGLDAVAAARVIFDAHALRSSSLEAQITEARLRVRAGDPSRAKRGLDEAWEHAKADFSGDPSVLGTTAFAACQILLENSLSKDALPHCHEALRLEEVKGSTGRARSMLGRALAGAGATAEARAVLTQAVGELQRTNVDEEALAAARAVLSVLPGSTVPGAVRTIP